MRDKYSTSTSQVDNYLDDNALLLTMSTPFQLGSGAPSAYSEQDVLRYLERIGFIDHGTKQKVMPPPTMATLSRIMLHHLSSCPFENTVIHCG